MESRVLLLGASGMVYSDTGPGGTPASLVQRELTARRPDLEWACFAEEIPPARDMSARVEAAVRRWPPTAVLLAISASYFTYDYVIARVRRRWPRLYPVVQRLTGDVKAVAGGGFRGGGSLRGELFRLPRRLALAAVGAEPYMRVEHAIQNTIAALDLLAALPGVPVLCDLPRMNSTLSETESARYRPRVERFNAAVTDACRERGAFVYDLEHEMGSRGLRAARVDDGLHSDLPTRQWQAAFVAERILERLAPSPKPRQVPRRTRRGPPAGSP